MPLAFRLQLRHVFAFAFFRFCRHYDYAPPFTFSLTFGCAEAAASAGFRMSAAAFVPADDASFRRRQMLTCCQLMSDAA